MKSYYVKEEKVLPVYSSYFHYEKDRLKEIIILSGIKYKPIYWTYYEHFIENERLPVYRKSNKTAADEIGVSVSQIKKLKELFQKLGLITVVSQHNHPDLIYFRRLKNNPEKATKVKYGGQKKAPKKHKKELIKNNEIKPEDMVTPQEIAKKIKERLNL